MSVPNLISERNVSGNNACAAGSGLGHSEMGIPGCWVVVLPLLCAVAPGKTFLLCISLPSTCILGRIFIRKY